MTAGPGVTDADLLDADLLVVGGGPVGVGTALLAATRGLRATVIERDTVVHDLPRAIVMDDEVQRIFQGAGLASELAGITTRLRGGEFVGPDGERVMGIELADDLEPALGHWPVVAYYQPELEAFLRGAATGRGVDLRLGNRVVSVGQDDDRAWADVEAADGSATRLSARWLVAADGAASPIRKQLGISFDDQGFDQDWLVLDARLRHPGVELPDLVQQICDPQRPATFVPGHGDHRRWEFQLQPGDPRDDFATPEHIWPLLAPWVGPDDVELIRAAVYRFHATVAGSMRAGRVFLAGDAAHQMPPFLGQGLCAGLRDAANLTWKLDLVARGLADDGLLDTYDPERRPHAAGVVAHAADVGRLIDQLAGRADAGVGTEAAYGGSRPFPHLTGGMLAGGHDLVGRQLPQPTIHGTPLDDLLGDGFALIAGSPADVPEAVAAAWEALGGRVVCDRDVTGMLLPPGGSILVRPDRYVAAVAEGPDELTERSGELLSWCS